MSFFFKFKQWGGRRKKLAGRALQGRTFNEFPLALRLEPASPSPDVLPVA